MPSVIAKFTAAASVLSFCAALAFSARAETVSYPDFTDTAGLTFTGKAAAATTSDGTVLRLTAAKAYQAGAVYITTPIALGVDDMFSSSFQFRFTDPGGIDPADGVTLVLAANPNGLGASIGGGLGYRGVDHSIAIEYDTFNDVPYDSNDNHVAVDEDGVLTNSFAATPYGVAHCKFSAAAGCMSNGDLWTTWIGYNGADLTVAVRDGSMAPQTLIDAPIDIAALLGANVVYIGLTAGTGAGHENQDIKDFAYSNTQALVSAAPEPSTWTMMLLGVSGVCFALRMARSKSGDLRSKNAAAI